MKRVNANAGPEQDEALGGEYYVVLARQVPHPGFLLHQTADELRPPVPANRAAPRTWLEWPGATLQGEPANLTAWGAAASILVTA